MKGHNVNDTTTQTRYGYCALPDETCNHRTFNTDTKGTGSDNSFGYKDNFEYCRNTGVINARIKAMPAYDNSTSNNNGILSEEVVKRIFTHELGHSFGAKHDGTGSGCNPAGLDNYIMTGHAKVYSTLVVT